MRFPRDGPTGVVTGRMRRNILKGTFQERERERDRVVSQQFLGAKGLMVREAGI